MRSSTRATKCVEAEANFFDYQNSLKIPFLKGFDGKGSISRLMLKQLHDMKLQSHEFRVSICDYN